MKNEHTIEYTAIDKDSYDEYPIDPGTGRTSFDGTPGITTIHTGEVVDDDVGDTRYVAWVRGGIYGEYRVVANSRIAARVGMEEAIAREMHSDYDVLDTDDDDVEDYVA